LGMGHSWQISGDRDGRSKGGAQGDAVSAAA
jgi:hypothetical protein